MTQQFRDTYQHGELVIELRRRGILRRWTAYLDGEPMLGTTFELSAGTRADLIALLDATLNRE